MRKISENERKIKNNEGQKKNKNNRVWGLRILIRGDSRLNFDFPATANI